jgi:hypothetical protein
MKTISLWKNTIVVAALLAVLFPILGKAGPMGKAGPLEKAGPLVGKHCLSVKNRPLSDFLNAQGTSSTFFYPVKDYVGWTDSEQSPTIFALVDYAGLANEYITATTGHSLGTEVVGRVVECKLADGAQITVALFTTNALGFAQSIADINQYGFLGAPTIFGAKAQDVVNGAPAAVGPVILLTTFSISAPGAALPDLVDVLVNNPQNYAPVELSFASITFGRCPNGRKARLDVHEVASTNDQGELIFSIEKVEVVDTHGGNCGG